MVAMMAEIVSKLKKKISDPRQDRDRLGRRMNRH
jgi:hypothetical protein